MAVNVLSILYLTISIIFSFFPPTPVTAENMNWSPVLFLVLIVVVGVVHYYFEGRKMWKGPIAEDVNLRAVRRLDSGTRPEGD